MYEMAAVFIVYAVISFIAMAALWTVAVKKGVIARPAFFFWLKEKHKGYIIIDDALNYSLIGFAKTEGYSEMGNALTVSGFEGSKIYLQTGTQGASVQDQFPQNGEWNRGFVDAPDSHNSLATLRS